MYYKFPMSNIKTIIIVAGLPGSGKTTWSNNQAKNIGVNAIVIDDPSIDLKRWNVIKSHHTHVFVADPYLSIMTVDKVCAMLTNRIGVDISKIDLKWVCLENNLQKSLGRARPSVTNVANRLQEKYIIPQNAMRLPWNDTSLSWNDCPNILPLYLKKLVYLS